MLVFGNVSFWVCFFFSGRLVWLTSSVFRNTVPFGRISVETKAIHAARFVVNTPTRHYRTWQRRHGSFTLDPGAGDERATTAWASRNAFGNCANDTNTRNILAADVSSGILEPPRFSKMPRNLSGQKAGTKKSNPIPFYLIAFPWTCHFARLA